MMSRRLIAIVGPTGSGKSSLAVEIAQALKTEIISTDSRQFYRGMAIGTAQPTAQELSSVRHHFIAEREPTEHLNCAEYADRATDRLEELFTKHSTVVAVGGSGLYIDALCRGLDQMPQTTSDLRQALNDRCCTEGLNSLLKELEELDPAYYNVVDKQNPQRVVRALEVCLASGKTYTSFRQGATHQKDFQTTYIGTKVAREELYERINSRVDAMVEAGIESEARALFHLRHLPSLRTVGYSEMFDYFDNTISFDRAVELIKQNSRRYAKRQMTWFLRNDTIKWIEPHKVDEVMDYISM